jgi:hypothetical protein
MELTNRSSLSFSRVDERKRKEQETYTFEAPLQTSDEKDAADCRNLERNIAVKVSDIVPNLDT